MRSLGCRVAAYLNPSIERTFQRPLAPFGPPLMSNVGPLNSEIDCRCRIVLGGINMNQTFTAIVKNDGEWWIGWVEEVTGVNCQERSRDELLKTLRVTLMEALEMNRADARDAGGKGYEELSIVV